MRGLWIRYFVGRVIVQIENLRFHDSRNEAITRLAQKLEPLELARMIGHKNLNMLLIYYNQTAEQLAQKLG